jgi:hypothetical protein
MRNWPNNVDAIYRAQPPDDGYMLARSVSDPNHKVQVRVEISFREIASWAGRTSICIYTGA